MLTITESALNKIKEMRIANEQEGFYFKFGVGGGGCSGLSYKMNLVEKINNEEQVQIGNETILIEKNDVPIIKGTKIDFKGNMMGGGFIIENPNAILTCGCGSSFRTEKTKGNPEKCD